MVINYKLIEVGENTHLGIVYGTLITLDFEKNIEALYVYYRCCSNLMGISPKNYNTFKDMIRFLYIIIPYLNKMNRKTRVSKKSSDLNKFWHMSLIKFLSITVELSGEALWDSYVASCEENKVKNLLKKEYKSCLKNIEKGEWYEKEKK